MILEHCKISESKITNVNQMQHARAIFKAIYSTAKQNILLNLMKHYK